MFGDQTQQVAVRREVGGIGHFGQGKAVRVARQSLQDAGVDALGGKGGSCVFNRTAA